MAHRASSYRDYTSICSPALSETLAIVALDHREAILSLQKAHAQANLLLVEEVVARTNEKGEGLSWTAPAEGVVGFLRFPGGLPAWKAGEELVERFGTLVVPGDCFYPLPDTEDKEGPSQQSSHFRLGFGYESDSLEAGLRALEQYIDMKRAG